MKVWDTVLRNVLIVLLAVSLVDALMTNEISTSAGTGDLQVNASGSYVNIVKTLNTSGLVINTAYTFATSDGNADDVLTSDGSGVLSWNAQQDTLYTAVQPYIFLTGTAFAGNETAINTTIDNRLTTTYYNVTQYSIVVGTPVGLIASTHHQDGSYDSVTFNLTEASGSPGLDARMNFTNITKFSSGVMRYFTSALAGDYPVIQLWNYDVSSWEDYPQVVESASFTTIEQSVFDSTDHVDGSGVVQMRMYKAGNGNTNNHYYIDWIAIASGVGIPSGQEVDPYWTGEKKLYINWSDWRLNTLNYTDSCAAGEVYEWGTGCITTPTGGGGGVVGENSTLWQKTPNAITSNVSVEGGAVDVTGQLFILNNLSSANPINIMPSGDTDDYLKFVTESWTGIDIPRIQFVGGSRMEINDGDGGDNMGLRIRGADAASSARLELLPDDGAASRLLDFHALRGTLAKGMFFQANNVSDRYLNPATTSAYGLGTTNYKWNTGFITNAWTVGDLVFNYGDVNGTGGTNYRIIEAEKVTNNKLKGLMYVMDDTAVMWIEPDGKLHTTQEIDTTWAGITGLSFDDEGGVYKDDKVVRYPAYGPNKELPQTYVDDKAEYAGDILINKVAKKPGVYVNEI